MRAGQQRPDGRQVGRAEQAGRPQRAGVLGDHVPGAAAEQAVRYPVHVGEVGVAQRGHAEQGRRLRAGVSPTAVLALEVAVRRAGVDDQQGQPEGVEIERHRLHAQAAHVAQQDVARDRQRGRELIHPTGRRADQLGLGHPGQFGPLVAVKVEAEQIANRACHRAADCRGGGQAGADRHVAVQFDGEAGRRPVGVAEPGQRPEHPGGVAGPAVRAVQPLGAGHEIVAGDRHRSRALAGADRDHRRPASPGDGGGAALLDGKREREPVVVVGVLADQVDPTRGPPTAGCPLRRSHGGADHTTSRRRAAAVSAGMSLIHVAAEDSAPARYFSRSWARRIVNTSPARCQLDRNWPTGACSQAAM